LLNHKKITTMKRFSFGLLTACLGFLLFGCTQPVPVRETVHTESGKVSGEFIDSSGVTVFKGIPFAAPPVGDLRWKAPQPVKKWEGIKECTRFSASPMQSTPVPFMMWTQEFIAPREPLSEDCLYLNLWTGAEKAGEKRPVFVYIYGGGFNSGSGAVPVYDGEEMAKKGLVFITFNYRVGILGFLAHPELTAESEYQASGNYGLLDQVEVLRWVHKNIEAFGGDPSNVTIAGQSAGAFSVNYLVASPLTKGLIHRAIAESGGTVLRVGNSLRGEGLAEAEKTGKRWAEALGIKSLAEARALSAEKIAGVAGPGEPIVDGYVIPEPVEEIFEKGKQNDIPLILGWNEDEGFGGPPRPAEEFKKQVKQRFGEKAGEFLSRFPIESDDDAFALQNDLGALQIFGVQSYKWMLLQHQTGTADVYLYRFERDLPYADGMQDHGAFHTGEVPYAYNNLKMSPRPWETVDYELAARMSDYWVNFAATGNPNGNGLPHWEACTPDNLKAMIFDTEIECTGLPNAELLDFLEGYYSSQDGY
jgi:para-nitrobenzyl esterase